MIRMAVGLIFSTLLSADVDISNYVKDTKSTGFDVSSYSKFNSANTDQGFNDIVAASTSGNSREYLKEYYRKNGVSAIDVEKFFKYIDNKGIPQPEDKSTTIFFLTSNSVPVSNTTNFLVGYNRLKKKNPELQGYVVLNGFIKKKGGVKAYMESTGIKTSDVVLKIHPTLFKRLKIEKVPAFLISECPKNSFKERFCDHKIIAYGGMPLEQFLNIVEEKSSEEKYKKLYYDLINPN